MDNDDSEGPVITLKPHILIYPMLFSYINNSYYCKVIFFPLHFQSVPSGDGKKKDSINIPLRMVAFSSTNFHINLLWVFYTNAIPSPLHCPTPFTHFSSASLISSSPERDPPSSDWLVSGCDDAAACVAQVLAQNKRDWHYSCHCLQPALPPGARDQAFCIPFLTI